MLNDNKPTLYLIRGVPGSGKSSFSKCLWVYGLVESVVEADHHFMDCYGNYNFDSAKLGEAHQKCKEAVEYYLRNDCSVVVSNTSTTEKEVKVYQDIAEKYGANFVSIIVENRRGGTNVHNVPEEKIQQMKDRFSVKL